MENAFITIVWADEPCGKSADVEPDGSIKFTSLGSAIAGTAQVVHVPTATTLFNILRSLKGGQYVSPDYVPAMVGKGPFRLVEQWQHKQAFGVDTGAPMQNEKGVWFVTQNLTPGVWTFGAWRVLDRDVDDLTPHQFRGSYGEWAVAVEQLLPGWSAAPRVVWPSSKARVFVEGGSPRSSLNCHTWVLCAGTDKTNAVQSSLKVKATEIGYAWHTPRHDRKTGEVLKGNGTFRTVFDLAVWTIHRNIYSAPPVLKHAELVLADVSEAQCVANDGAPALDLSLAAPVLTVERVRTYAAKAQVQANLQRDGRMTVTDKDTMTLLSEVELEDGRTLTVGEFMRDDKTEFGVKYRCQSMFRKSDSMNGLIRKFETGRVMHFDNGTGTVYFLNILDWQFAAERFASAPDKAAALSALGKSLAELGDAEFAMLKAELVRLTKLPVSALTAARKEAKAAAAKAHAKVEQARVQAEYAEEARHAEGQHIDIAEIKTARQMLAHLSANWVLALGTGDSYAVTFFREQVGANKVLRFSQHTIKALRAFTSPFYVSGYNGAGVREQVPAIDAWLQSAERKAVRRVTFEPGFPARYEGGLNLWTGFAIEQGNPAGAALFVRHVREVIGGGDKAIGEYVLNWLALRVQGIANRKLGQPLPRMEVCIVLRSVPGTGKGVLETYLAKLFGDHAMITSRGEGLTGRFNWEFADKVLLCADEAFFVGDGKQHDALKSYLTEPVFTFEKKFQDSVSLPNHCGVIMSTNREWAVPADAGDRRMCVLDVSQCRKGDSAYFKAFIAERDGTGPADLLAYLMKHDISQFDVREFPRTQALEEQQVSTIGRGNATAEWLHECLETGTITLIHDDDDRSTYSVQWPEHTFRLSRRGVGLAVRALAHDMRKYSPPSNDSIGRALYKMAANRRGDTKVEQVRKYSTRILSEVDPEEFDDVAPKSESQPAKVFVNAWEFPGLSEAKERFSAYLAKGSY